MSNLFKWTLLVSTLIIYELLKPILFVIEGLSDHESDQTLGFIARMQ